MSGAARTLWALGDYGKIAEIVADLGVDLVAAARPGPGMRVLDVGAGTGNASLPAARRGAEVVAADPTPELLAVGRARAEDAHLPVTWVEADAQHLPFDDGEFDQVLSCIGAMFAPDQEAAARELLRVCRPGGTLALAGWTPDGGPGRFFRILGRHFPPTPGPSPTDWGDPVAVERLLGAGVTRLTTEVCSITARFTGEPAELVAFYRRHFPPVVATFAAVEGDVERTEALERDLLGFAEGENTSEVAGRGRYVFEYLLVLATRVPGAVLTVGAD
ncbi:class I SAM-dependent methyltransferase [Cellulomonas sp.]|uniref:class I SAM-dependent methyltransferase n=1 Tax=Cellulomonas sp. TaxID=40001 RepID=UPI003BAD8872